MIHAQVTRNNDNSIHLLRIEVTEESLPDFISLINRALNCWDSAPKDLKDLGDLITHDRVTQDHTPTQINTNQNTDHYSHADFLKIQEYINQYGHAAWYARTLNGTTGAVLKGTATD